MESSMLTERTYAKQIVSDFNMIPQRGAQISVRTSVR